MKFRKVLMVGVAITLWLARTADMVFAQGLVNFNNRVTSSSPTVDASISLYCPNGPRISGEDLQWRAALLGGPTNATPAQLYTDGTMTLLASPNTGATWVTFRTGGIAGYVAVGSDGARDSGLPYGSFGMFQVAVWHGTETTWRDARQNSTVGITLVDVSAPVIVQVSAATNSPSNLAGLSAFYVRYWDDEPGPRLLGPGAAPILALPGSTVTLHYEVLSPLPTSYFWYFNGVPITTNYTTTLTITNVTVANEGMYYFLASNACAMSGQYPYGPVGPTPLLIKKVRLGTTNVIAQNLNLFATGTTGTPFQVFSSTNLKDWEVVGNYSNAFGTVQITNIDVTASATRFYRAVLQ
jgi:hypothetical protein